MCAGRRCPHTVCEAYSCVQSGSAAHTRGHISMSTEHACSTSSDAAITTLHRASHRNPCLHPIPTARSHAAGSALLLVCFFAALIRVLRPSATFLIVPAAQIFVVLPSNLYGHSISIRLPTRWISNAGGSRGWRASTESEIPAASRATALQVYSRTRASYETRSAYIYR